jgi:hypothetical protein
MRPQSRDSEEWALNDQLRQSEKERKWDREIDDLYAEIRQRKELDGLIETKMKPQALYPPNQVDCPEPKGTTRIGIF